MSANIKLFIVLQDSYFKDDDFEQPLKRYLKPYYLTSAYNESIYYYMQISNNLAKHYDNKVYGGPVNDYFIESRVDY